MIAIDTAVTYSTLSPLLLAKLQKLPLACVAENQ